MVYKLLCMWGLNSLRIIGCNKYILDCVVFFTEAGYDYFVSCFSQ